MLPVKIVWTSYGLFDIVAYITHGFSESYVWMGEMEAEYLLLFDYIHVTFSPLSIHIHNTAMCFFYDNVMAYGHSADQTRDATTDVITVL